MANYAEEQELEKEALESLFPEEYKSDGPDKFQLELTPGEAENHVCAPLIIQYPASYPDEKPIVKLNDEIPTGLPDKKQAELLKVIDRTIEENVGIPMIYTLAEAVQEYLRSNNVCEVSMHDMMLNRQRDAGELVEEESEEEEDEQPEEDDGEWKGLEEKTLVAASERVIRADFIAWKKKFDLELVAQGIITRHDDSRVTGKKIFEEAQARDKAAGKDTTKVATEVEVDADLFGDEELPDDDEIDFSDDEEE